MKNPLTNCKSQLELTSKLASNEIEGLKVGPKMLLVSLSTHVNYGRKDKKFDVFPSNKTMGQESNLGLTAVKAGLKTLLDLGYIAPVGFKKTDKGKPIVVYQIAINNIKFVDNGRKDTDIEYFDEPVIDSNDTEVSEAVNHPPIVEEAPEAIEEPKQELSMEDRRKQFAKYDTGYTTTYAQQVVEQARNAEGIQRWKNAGGPHGDNRYAMESPF